MHRTEPTRLQSLALQLSEKVSSLVDFNERMMEAKQGGGFFNYQRGGGDQQGYRRDQRGEGYGGMTFATFLKKHASWTYALSYC